MVPARRAFSTMVQPPIPSARIAALSQTTSHSPGSAVRDATSVAASAVSPIATPPHPGTAVNAVARSMVERMNDRLSIARACRAGDGVSG
jgi:hypothetical protein